MIHFENIRKSYERELVGKKFVYISKYGSETLCEVKDINMVTHIHGNGRAPKIKIVSTMGNVYELDKDNIYFIE